MDSSATPANQRQSKNPLWFIVPFVASIVVLFSGHPGWAILLYIVSLVAAAVAHPDMPFKRTAVCVIIAIPALFSLFVLLFLMSAGVQTT
ncbi:hypothetical protein [Corynebacterium glyciniphilum]|uniref:hypothetical protein n=1 Tax=Corynebacterium glyciniphilum TaxID=1404244 RepID=UPI0011AB335B|nr:hypothetical protein [Corynebacterium glyciniphilum]